MTTNIRTLSSLAAYDVFETALIIKANDAAYDKRYCLNQVSVKGAPIGTSSTSHMLAHRVGMSVHTEPIVINHVKHLPKSKAEKFIESGVLSLWGRNAKDVKRNSMTKGTLVIATQALAYVAVLSLIACVAVYLLNGVQMTKLLGF